MEKIYCPIHNLTINIYSREEENLFVDDNGKESVIFCNQDDKYLKRFNVNQCDNNCSTIKEILGE